MKNYTSSASLKNGKLSGMICSMAVFMLLVAISPAFAQAIDAPNKPSKTETPDKPAKTLSPKTQKGIMVTPPRKDLLESYLQADDETLSKKIDAAEKEEDKAVDLSLSSVVLFAVSDNPDIKIGLAQEKQAAANTGKAKAHYQPLVDITTEGGLQMNDPAPNTANGSTHTNSTRRTDLSMRQLIYDWGQTKATVDQQAQLQKSAKIQTRINEEGVLTDTITAYLDILNYQRSLASTEKFVIRMRELKKIIKEMYEGGGTSKATLDYANSRLASSETDMNTIRSNLNDAISNLEYLTGKLPKFTAIEPDDLDPIKLDIKQYVDIAQKENATLQHGQSDLRAMDYKLDQAKKAYYPTVAFVGTGADKFNDGGEVGVIRSANAVVQLSMRLYDGHERKEQINLVKGQKEELEITQQKAAKDLMREIKLAYNQVISAQEAMKQTEKEVSSSEALQKTNRENFKYGSINIIELVEGEERLNVARSKINQQRSDLYLNTYRVLLLAGILKKNYFCESCG